MSMCRNSMPRLVRSTSRPSTNNALLRYNNISSKATHLNAQQLIVPSKQSKLECELHFCSVCSFLAKCFANDKQGVLKMLANGANIDACNADGLTALHHCCIENNYDMVQFLVDHDACVNHRNNEGWTPLHIASAFGFVHIARYLVQHGANVHATTDSGETALDLAAHAQLPMMEYLREVKNVAQSECDRARQAEEFVMLKDARNWLMSGDATEVDRENSQTGATALHVAATKGYTEVVRMLLACQANINKQDHAGWTPLHKAAYWAHANTAIALIEAKANLHIRNKNNETFIDVADAKLLDDLKMYWNSKQKALPELAKSSKARIKIGETKEKGKRKMKALILQPQSTEAPKSTASKMSNVSAMQARQDCEREYFHKYDKLRARIRANLEAQLLEKKSVNKVSTLATAIVANTKASVVHSESCPSMAYQIGSTLNNPHTAQQNLLSANSPSVSSENNCITTPIAIQSVHNNSSMKQSSSATKSISMPCIKENDLENDEQEEFCNKLELCSNSQQEASDCLDSSAISAMPASNFGSIADSDNKFKSNQLIAANAKQLLTVLNISQMLNGDAVAVVILGKNERQAIAELELKANNFNTTTTTVAVDEVANQAAAQAAVKEEQQIGIITTVNANEKSKETSQLANPLLPNSTPLKDECLDYSITNSSTAICTSSTSHPSSLNPTNCMDFKSEGVKANCETTDYKELWEKSKNEILRLEKQIQDQEQSLLDITAKLNQISASQELFKIENERLKEENGSLIRVVSKLCTQGS